MLPPGPREPAALQTVEWVVRPTALLRRAQARYGEPFTLRTAWSDAPLVLVSDPDEVRRIYTAPGDVLQAGDSSAFLEPFVGPRSVLILNGDEHLRQRRLVLPPFHGEALRRWTQTIAEIANGELDTWVPGRPLRALPRMQALTLEVIQRVIFGSRDAELRDALREAMDLTGSMPRLVAMSLLGPGRRFTRAVERVDEVVYARIDAAVAAGGAGAPGSILDLLVAAGATREELRDQLVTLLAAGHETTATALAWALERLARHPDTPLDDDAHIDAAVKEVLRTRPVLSITARKTLQPYDIHGYTLPPGVYVAACLYLAHRRTGTGFDPTRHLNGQPDPYTFIPFGGGTRRCLGAAFATLEMREVLRAVSQRFTLAPDRPQGERMRRRSVTLAPSRGGSIIPRTR
jgi:cytochrome P450